MRKIGVLQDHGEELVPGATGFSAFFGALGRERATVRALPDAEARAGLAGFDAVLLGRPTRLIPEEVLRALKAWVAAGGRLLLTGGAGGDRPPTGGGRGETNLSQVIDGLSFRDDVVFWQTSMEMDDNLVVPIDLSPLGRHLAGRSLDYVSGCTLELAAGCRVAASLDASSSEAMCFPMPAPEDGDMLSSSWEGEAAPARGPIFAELSVGLGRVLALGSTSCFHDELLRRKTYERHEPGARGLLEHVIRRWIASPAPDELARRLTEPQRHRLLQGYPMPKLMEDPAREIRPEQRGPHVARRDTSSFGRNTWYDSLWPGQHRQCIVGVLPHPFCNPTVRGCGFCTFPQEKLARDRMPALTEAVRADIASFREHLLQGATLATPALYFGGATANLTPAEGFEAICREVSRTFDTRGAEVTLEGVPRYFGIDDHRLMRAVLDAFPEASPRISMGVQTFERAQIERMGRAGFGDRREIEALVGRAHAMGFSVSCDLMINLPGQSLPQMLEDLEIAAGAGFDQICVYHLVLFEGLGTPWSEDRSLLSMLKGNDQNFSNQRRCRKRLYELGFTQTTLTNFERRAGERPRFRYEPLGYRPDRHDLLGFGPAAISLASARDFRRGWKLVGAQDAAGYLQGDRRRFFYDQVDMKLLFLTRSIAGLEIDTACYGQLFGSTVLDDFPEETAALLDRGLLRERPGRLSLTPEGMFFADSVAGLLAWRRVQVLRDELESPPTKNPPPVPHLRFHDPNIATYGGMG
jgi:coproporphyrinogen III oxidase-like Fe-S oxidoreductase